MITPLIITRENIQYAIYKEITSEGDTTLYIEDVVARSIYGKVRRYLSKIEIIFTGTKGKVLTIGTTWGAGFIAVDSGEVIPGSDKGVDVEEFGLVVTNPQDLKTFSLMFGDPIFMFIINGYIREKKGYNHLPALDTRTKVNGAANPNFGKPLIYSAYLESTPRTNDYMTWKEGDPLPEVLTEPVE